MCQQTGGLNPNLPTSLFPIPPVPQVTLPAPWAGQCTFTTPGVYTFYCTAHPEMIGDITVAAANNPPTVTASRTPTGDVLTGQSVVVQCDGSRHRR